MTVSPDRLPVILGVGQAIERHDPVTPRDLMERAAWQALDDAPGVGQRLQQVIAVNVLHDDHHAPATAVARRLGLRDVECLNTTVGGNTPGWLLTRVADEIAAGTRDATIIVGAEALRARKGEATPPDPDADLLEGPPDPKIGVDRFGVGDAESAIRLYLPIHMYPMFESAMAARAGRSFEEQRRFVAEFMARNAAVAAKHPYAWFPTEATPDELATVTPANRLTAEPYTKRLNAIMSVNQGAALVVTSLAVAQDLGIADRAIFVWSGADTTDVWCPSQRPDLASSPGIKAAGDAVLAAAGVGVDDIDRFDFYSCFPSAIQAGAGALGLALDDPRGLTVTGGLAYFGGPGNNYTTHSLATTVDLLREGGGFGLCTGLGWFTTKHSVSLLGAAPPAEGFRRGDTSAAQAAIDASEIEVTLDATGSATVVASTVIYDREGAPANVPVFADLPDGRRVAAMAAAELVPLLAGRSLVGETINLVSTDPLTFALAEG